MHPIAFRQGRATHEAGIITDSLLLFWLPHATTPAGLYQYQQPQKTDLVQNK